MSRLVYTLMVLCCAAPLLGDETKRALPSLYDIAPDLVVPRVENTAPSAGRRVLATTADWETTAVHHVLHLPRDWRPGAKFPMLVEYAGNGGFSNALGDSCSGTVEGCNIGYGLSGGTNFIWIAMPFVQVTNGVRQNARNWWGDVAESKRYCIATVKEVCARFGGDADRVILCGFSRGSIACNFIGLHNDEIAKLWCGFFCHSHYDGVRENWPYAGAGRASALSRLQRLGNRPQWISHEGSVAATQRYLDGSGVTRKITFAPLPFPNHTDSWLLRDLPLRAEARAWLRDVVN